MRTGFFRMYMRNASDDQRPIAWISEGGAPLIANAVAPPARIDWPPMLLSKNEWSRDIKKVLVGIVPSLLSHSGELSGNKRSREDR